MKHLGRTDGKKFREDLLVTLDTSCRSKVDATQCGLSWLPPNAEGQRMDDREEEGLLTFFAVYLNTSDTYLQNLKCLGRSLQLLILLLQSGLANIMAAVA